MIRNRDIVVFGLQPWDIAIGSNCKDMALELSKHNRVLYINQPADITAYWFRKNDPIVKNRLEVKQGKRSAWEVVNQNLTVFSASDAVMPLNWMNWKGMHRLINKWNNTRFAANVKEAIAQMGFRNYILINDSSMFTGFHMKELLNPAFTLYYIRDFLTSQPFFGKHGKSMEPQLIRKSDAVITNSKFLEKYAQQFNDKAHYIGQGCDTTPYLDCDKLEIPEDIRFMKKPIIGYTGNITSKRLDPDLLYFLAEQRPEWNFVLVGPMDEVFKSHAIQHLRNVYFIGSRKPEQLPAYVGHFDVCINPQILNDLTVGNYPRKIDEYLAAGKPVVATETEATGIFADTIYTAKNHQEFLEAVEKSLQENPNEKRAARVEMAMSHSWEASIGELSKIVEHYEHA